MRKVMTGRELVMAAAKVAEVYTRATPYIFKLKVILNIEKNIYMFSTYTNNLSKMFAVHNLPK